METVVAVLERRSALLPSDEGGRSIVTVAMVLASVEPRPVALLCPPARGLRDTPTSGSFPA